MPRTEPTCLIGDDKTYATVWNWKLSGSNEEIGAALAAWGGSALQTAPLPAADPARIRAQQRFFYKHYRPFHDRMEGVANSHGLLLEECGHDLSTLWFDVQMPGCSAAFVPRQRIANGHAHVLRNMDLGTDLTGDVEHPSSSRILMLELEPSDGFASLSAVVFDLLSAMDGINEKGLVVVCNSHGDYRLDTGYLSEPVQHPEPGLNELQVVRYLLDMCADTEDAKEALLSLRTYYSFTPCLYLIADARGRAFVCEKSQAGNRIEFTEVASEPLAMTNFGRTRFKDDADMPADDGPAQGFMYTRYRTLLQGIASQDKHELGSLHAIARSASFDNQGDPRSVDDMHPDRAIYTTIYDLDERAVFVSCYLGEGDQGALHSNPQRLALGSSDV